MPIQAKPTTRKSWRDILPVHPAAELFPPLPPDELRALGEDIKKNGLTSPIVLWEAKKNAPLLLLDGRNRLDAMEAAGLPVLDKDGKWLDWGIDCRSARLRGENPYAFAISANIHRRHLTAEQKRDLIAKLIKAAPEKSDRQIAETVKASPTTVGTVRREMETKGEVSKLDTRTDAKGVKQPAKKDTTATAAAQRERARARREAKRRQQSEERRKQLDAEEAEAKAKAAQLAADLIKVNLAARVLAYLTYEAGDPLDLQDALHDALRGRAVPREDDPEAAADAMKAKFAEMDAADATSDATTPKRDRGRPKGSKNKPTGVGGGAPTR
jgi:hypothetical protein